MSTTLSIIADLLNTDSVDDAGSIGIDDVASKISNGSIINNIDILKAIHMIHEEIKTLRAEVLTNREEISDKLDIIDERLYGAFAQYRRDF